MRGMRRLVKREHEAVNPMAVHWASNVVKSRSTTGAPVSVRCSITAIACWRRVSSGGCNVAAHCARWALRMR